jgi:hypothetical protein
MGEQAERTDQGEPVESGGASPGKKKTGWGKRIFLALVIIVILGVLGGTILVMSLGTVVTTAVNTIGPRVTGVDVHLGGASIAPFRGAVELNELTVANPEGFTREHKFFRAGRIKVDVNLPAFFRDEIHVREIIVDGPEFAFQAKLNGSTNYGAIMETLEQREKAAEDEEAEEEEAAPGKRLKIDLLRLTDVRVGIVAAGATQDVTLDKIELRDIQDPDGNGIPISSMLSEILVAVVKAAPGVDVAGVAETVKEMGKGAAKTAATVGEGAAKTAKEAAEGAAKTAKEAGKEAAETVKGVGEKLFGE